MIKPKISIIIPVYNPGPYFENCLSSLVSQTLREIEVILILDCPTDGSDKVAERFAKEDERIKLIYNETNIHIGLSRNKGLDIARGEYIGFHDADDYCEPVMYEMLYSKAIQEEQDVVRCNFKCIYPKGSGIDDEFYKYPEVTEDASKKVEIYEKVCSDTVSCVIWNHIFKSDFLSRHNLKFADSRYITSEDSIFFIEAYQYLDKLGVVPDYLYYHIFHQTNTGKSYKYRSVKNRIVYFEWLYHFLREKGVDRTDSLSFISGNAIKSLYTASSQAFLLFPLKKAMSEIGQIKNNDLMIYCINYMFKKENHKILFRFKPTIISFFFVIKLFSRKQSRLSL